MKWINLVVLAGICMIPSVAMAEEEIARAMPEQIEKWQAMRFGMFIHWGPVSLTGKEIGWSRATNNNERQTPWQEYDQLYTQFNPAHFDASEWVDIAQDAGMKYMVYTSKHHDGFACWDSAYTDYDIMSSPLKRDIMKELTDACKEQGLAFGPYHSICDWYQPDYGYSHQAKPGYTLDREPDMETYYTYLTNQLRELQKNYGPFLVFWFDGEWEKPWTHELGVRLNNFCRALQPDVLINNRVDKGRDGMAGTMVGTGFAGDFLTPEQRVGTFNRDFPWETCMTICQQWAWKPSDKLKSLKECLQTLIYTVGGDGNLLFNVGPMPDGRIEPRQVERLREMGAWMKEYGHAIYGTRGGPYMPGAWGASTCKEDKIYLFVMGEDRDKVTLPALPVKMLKSRILSGETGTVTQSGGPVSIQLGSNSGHEIATVIELQVDGKALEIKPIVVEKK
jgi:alpha-L-fucosidase